MGPKINPKVEKAVRLALGGQSVKGALQASGKPCSEENLRKHIRNARARSNRSNDSGDRAAAQQTQKGTGLPFRRSSKQVYAADRAALAKKRNFDLAFAEATTRYANGLNGPSSGAHSVSAPTIVKAIEKEFKLSPGRLQEQRVRKYVAKGKAGKAPEQRGGGKLYPGAVFQAAASQISVSGANGIEMSTKAAVQNIRVVVEGAVFQGKGKGKQAQQFFAPYGTSSSQGVSRRFAPGQTRADRELALRMAGLCHL